MVAATHGFAAPSAFDAANQLYFEGRFAEAAAAYERMIDAGRASGVVWYNLGNAWYKAGQPGRAIAAYLRARELNPRDPDLRFNLRFVREKVTGRDVRADPAWRRVLRALTLNEWSRLWAAVFWGWFVLLMLRELRPAWRKPLHTASALAGTATVLLAIALTAAWRLSRVPTAVVIRTEAVVRQGPLERSPVAFKLRDGSELVVQDQQEIVDQGRTQQWLRIQDAGGRMGWLRRDEVVVTQG
ncbi:MAG: tetratricopeptide repeat protein [Verrucomicrobia bacterium]|nr:tetratricopeptide repeat protein [Verrucomicrobiota bacterium]